jgi:flagellar motility protein MotE (MotC chaperone)
MMKTMIQIVLVALIFGGLSAGGSIYWLKLNAPKPDPEATAKADATEEKETTDEQPEATAETESSEVATTQTEDASKPADETDQLPAKPEKKTEPASFGPPVAARPPFSPTADEAGDLIYKLRVRLASSTRQERRVAEREDAMKLIVEDLRAEQTKAAQLKKRLLDEQTQSMKTIDAARKAIDTERDMFHQDLADARREGEEKLQSALREKEDAVRSAEELVKNAREEQDELRKQLDDARNPANRVDRSGSPEQTANLKKTAKALESLPPEDTAKILKQTVLDGRTEAAVAILNAMKSRATADVISVITESDAELAAELVERLKRLKKDAVPTPPAPGLK